MGKAEKNKSVEQEPLKSVAFERRTSNRKEIWSDTFKLSVAKYIKRIGVATHPNEEPADFAEAEHVHFVRTYDSDGKQMDRSASIGGHFHLVKFDLTDKDNPKIVSVSGPMTLARKQVQGRWQTVAVPLNDYDHHVHDVEYVSSGKVKARIQNIEALKVIAFEAQKGTAPDGAFEG